MLNILARTFIVQTFHPGGDKVLHDSIYTLMMLGCHVNRCNILSRLVLATFVWIFLITVWFIIIVWIIVWIFLITIWFIIVWIIIVWI